MMDKTTVLSKLLCRLGRHASAFNRHAVIRGRIYLFGRCTRCGKPTTYLVPNSRLAEEAAMVMMLDAAWPIMKEDAKT